MWLFADYLLQLSLIPLTRMLITVGLVYSSIFALVAVGAHIPWPSLDASTAQDIQTVIQRRISTIIGETGSASDVSSWYGLLFLTRMQRH